MLCRTEAIVQAIVAMDGIEAVYFRANRYSAAACLLLEAVQLLCTESRAASRSWETRGRSPPSP